MSAIEWRNNDVGYLAWLTTHREGFIANIRSKDKRQFTIHKASCKLPDRSNPETLNPWTGNQYAKLTADTLTDLLHWGHQHGYQAAFQRCRRCNPV
jgi:5-methylcytosine-specific restriction protein A